jgi:flagellar assembly protein FliH
VATTSSDPRFAPAPAFARAEALRERGSAFIPREEMTGYASWSPGDLGGSVRAPQRRPVSTHEVASQAANDLQQARQHGYQDGYRDGLVALESFKQSFAAQTTAQVGMLVASLETQIDALHQSLADAVVETAVKLARQIVRSEIATRPELVAEVAREAVEGLVRSSKHVTLALHPDDEALVAGSGAAEALAARGGRLVADPGIARGGCVVASELGAVDATVATRWQRAVAAVGHRAAWEPPLGDD